MLYTLLLRRVRFCCFVIIIVGWGPYLVWSLWFLFTGTFRWLRLNASAMQLAQSCCVRQRSSMYWTQIPRAVCPQINVHNVVSCFFLRIICCQVFVLFIFKYAQAIKFMLWQPAESETVLVFCKKINLNLFLTSWSSMNTKYLFDTYDLRISWVFICILFHSKVKLGHGAN